MVVSGLGLGLYTIDGDMEGGDEKLYMDFFS